MRLKCKKCSEIIDLPSSACPICFGDILGEKSDIEDNEKRFESLQDFIQELTSFEYKRGKHNGKCSNKLYFDGQGEDWEELTEEVVNH